MEMPKEKEVTEVITCRAGAMGCPMGVIDVKAVAERLQAVLDEPRFKQCLAELLEGPFKYHSQFCAAVSGCPNACIQPQIRDFGVIGRARIGFDESNCTGCGMCEEACKEGALVLVEGKPEIDSSRCIGCSDCVRACQSDALSVTGRKHEVIAGGKLGRHPRLAETLGEFEAVEEVVQQFRRMIEFLLSHARKGERLGALLDRMKSESTS
ncbi:MAG: hypothetical protein C4520_01565 [Candidatus Abyssobacteria bacterium SURF_5]|uniref:4Fe-4S ferredoxin-type domain-containing protein n=1 Tax=Abyssobacteria bacterium (strain SURF_5) TaxID=2093360 RepID=A0A3A4P5W1_ABYX5|nr:MAG: hypothetical protein C4520_01565 [Candidatus Abyssubacteria bacterium SURF_5]